MYPWLKTEEPGPALRSTIAAPVDPLRFRANVYFDGVADWSELDWLEREIVLGAARLRVVSAITRCAATEVNPLSAERDRTAFVLQQLPQGRRGMAASGQK